MKPVNPNGNQPWIFIGRTDAEAEALILWPPDAKSRLIGKDPDAWKDGRQKGQRTAEDEIVRYHHWLNGHDFEQTLGDNEWQGSLACCSRRGCKELGMTEWLDNNLPLPVSLPDLNVSFTSLPELFKWYLLSLKHYFLGGHMKMNI